MGTPDKENPPSLTKTIGKFERRINLLHKKQQAVKARNNNYTSSGEQQNVLVNEMVGMLQSQLPTCAPQSRANTAANNYYTQAKQLSNLRQATAQSGNYRRKITPSGPVQGDTSQSPRSSKRTTDFTKVKMTRSMYRNHQEKHYSEAGIQPNIMPASKNSGLGMLILRNNRGSRNHWAGGRSFENAAGGTSSSMRIQRNGSQNSWVTPGGRKSSINGSQIIDQGQPRSVLANDGGYIQLQTNVDGSQAIIPMILSNEDLMKTTTDDGFQATQSSNEDVKKTILSKQVIDYPIPFQFPDGQPYVVGEAQTSQSQLNPLINFYQGVKAATGNNGGGRSISQNQQPHPLYSEETSFLSSRTAGIVQPGTIGPGQHTQPQKASTFYISKGGTRNDDIMMQGGNRWTYRQGTHERSMDLYADIEINDQMIGAVAAGGDSKTLLRSHSNTQRGAKAGGVQTSTRKYNPGLHGMAKSLQNFRSYHPQRASNGQTSTSQNAIINGSSQYFSGGQCLAQPVLNFGFGKIPDFKEEKTKMMRDQHLRKLTKQGIAEGSSESIYQVPHKPLFLTSTKKAPGLQRECAGSYVNVINNRTIMGQKSVFKFSMDLPLRLKQQMWLQHQQEKEALALMNVSSDQLASSPLRSTHQPLEIIGTSHSKLEHQSHQQNQIQASTQHNHLHIIPQEWTPHSPDLQPVVPLRDPHQISREGVESLLLLHEESIIQSPYQAVQPKKEDGKSDHGMNRRGSGSLVRDSLGSPEADSHRKSTKNSKIIYSINKSMSKHKNSIINRSKNGQLVENPTILKRSIESRQSRDSNQPTRKSQERMPYQHLDGLINVKGIKSTISSGYSNQVNKILQSAAVLGTGGDLILPQTIESGVNSSIVGSQDPLVLSKPLLVLQKRTESNAFLAQQSQNRLSLGSNGEERVLKDHDQEVEHQNQDLLLQQNSSMNLLKQSIYQPIVERDKPQVGTKEGSFHRKNRNNSQRLSKGGSPKYRHNAAESGRESHRFRQLASLQDNNHHYTIDPETGQYRFQDFNVTQISIKVGSRNRSATPAKHLTISIESQRAKTTFDGKSIKSATSMMVLQGSETKLERQFNQRRNFEMMESLPEPPLTSTFQRYTTQRMRKAEKHTNLLKSRSSSANNNQSGAHSRKHQQILTGAMTLIPQKDQEVIGYSPKGRAEESNDGVKLSIEATHLQLIKPQQTQQVNPKIKERETLHLNQNLVESLSKSGMVLPKVQSSHGGVTPKDKMGERSAQQQNQRPSASSLKQEPEEDIKASGDQGKKSTITINDEDIGFCLGNQTVAGIASSIDMAHHAQTNSVITDNPQLAVNNMTSHYKRESSILDLGEAGEYQIQAAMMEKIIVKSPGREPTTDMVMGTKALNFTSQTTMNFSQPQRMQKKSSSNSFIRRSSVVSNSSALNNSSTNGGGGTGKAVRRKSTSQNNQDLGLTQQLSPKRTVLIRKSRGQNDITQLVIHNTNQQQIRDSASGNQERASSGRTAALKYVKEHHSNAQSVKPLQFLPYDDLNPRTDLNLTELIVADQKKIVRQTKSSDLPRHGRAPPSVLKKNQMNKLLSRNGSRNHQIDIRKNQAQTVNNQNLMSATFHVVPITNNNATFYTKSTNSIKPKTPVNVYHHTSSLQALVIDHSELAIDADQQRRQLQLIQQFQKQQQSAALNQDLVSAESIQQKSLKIPIAHFTAPQAASQLSRISLPNNNNNVKKMANVESVQNHGMQIVGKQLN